MKDGSFLWLSERTGWKHLYHYTADCKQHRPVTTGKWEVRTFHGLDEANGWVYFSGTERSQIGGDTYRIRSDGSGLQRLTEGPGTHNANFNPSFSHFIDSWSDATTPTQVRLYSSDGKLVRVIDDNVHIQNSIQFIHELQKAGKQFEFMVYPKSRHGISDPKLVRHMREMMLNFILKNL